jgi:hypothetical protein
MKCTSRESRSSLATAMGHALPRFGGAAPYPTTVIGLRDRAARATVNATREAERNLCAEAAQRGSPAAR